jgi:hypothetical protein
MDVSFSAWRQTREESLVLKLESFAFLFDRRYTNRLNRMSRVFFEAYSKATKELAASEDRFPSLSEIDAKMESGAVYAFKDRLMKNTEFFEEVKISGVSYLVPRALRFIDSSGTYTDLAFDFDAGTAILPTRRKIPAPAEIQPQKGETIETPLAAASESEGPQEKTVVEAHPGHEPETYTEIEEGEEVPAPTPTPTPAPEASPSRDVTPLPQPRPREGALAEPVRKGKRSPTVAIVALAAVILIAAVAYFLIGLPPSSSPSMVMYSAYLSNVSNETYLGLDIKNQDGIMDAVEMTLPPDIDRSISAQGGVVTISHSYGTLIRLNSSQDASIRIYLTGNWTSVPVTFSLDVPSGFDSGLAVHGKDYNVGRNDSTIILKFNCTREGTNFEQSYTRKR